MDLKSLDLGSAAEEGVRVDLRAPALSSEDELDPNFEGELLIGDDGEPMYIVVVGKDSKTFKAQYRELQKRIGKLGEKAAKEYLASDQPEKDAVAALAACTIGGHLFWNGKAVEVTKDNVADCYNELPFVRQQVDKAINDRSLLNIDFKKN